MNPSSPLTTEAEQGWEPKNQIIGTKKDRWSLGLHK